MNRRRVGLILIVAGIIFAGAVGFLVYMQAAEAEQLRAERPKNFGVVALVDIPERTTITAEQLDVVRVPDQALPPGDGVYRPPVGASDSQIEVGKANAKSKVVGQLAAQRIYKGEVVNTERLGAPAVQARPALQVPPGKVWYHLPINVGAGGAPQSLITFLNFVRPGDTIDILLTDQVLPPGTTKETAPKQGDLDYGKTLYTRRIFQNVKVINVGPFPTGAAAAPQDRLITLELNSEDALKIKWLKDAAGAGLEFVVRSPQDPETTPSQTVGYDMMSAQTGIGTTQ
jgi:Flp pilus assembly protein CpaB